MSSTATSEPLTPDRLSGSTDRRRFLLVANLILLVLGLTCVIIAIVLLASFLLHHLDFASSLFLATPIALILAGLFTVGVAAYGLHLWRSKREMTAGFNLLGLALAAACFTCLVACILAFLLRQSVALTFSSTSVQGQIQRFEDDEVIARRWNALQRGYGCCGGGPDGYKDWAPSDGILRRGNTRIS